LIRSLDVLPRGIRVFIYGTGSAGKSLFMWLKKCREDIVVLGFIDSFKGGRCAGKKVFKTDRFVKIFDNHSYDRILIASGANRVMAERLDSLGITHYSTAAVPSYLMENLLPTPLSERIAGVWIRFLSLFTRRYTHLFFGEHGGKFLGNNKYYFLYLKEKTKVPIYWVTEDIDIYNELKGEGIDVFYFEERRFFGWLLRGAYFYFDNMTWQRKYPFLRHFRARIIHMSHGVGLKMTEKMMIPPGFMETLTPVEVKCLESKIFKNDLLISTSVFYAEKVSAPAYDTPLERITLSGYPKNDIFYWDVRGTKIFTDKETLDKVKVLKEKGFKVAVYAPTFRDMDSRFRYGDFVDDRTFNRYLADHKIVLVVKGHTSIANNNKSFCGVHGASPAFFQKEPLENTLFYRSDRDGYPLLKQADLLITDYSSIYMDFLHCRKPVIFFVYDYDEYTANHRDIQFDYNEMTPGPKARDYGELTRWLTHFLVENRDGYQGERERVLALAYAHADGNASERIFKEINERFGRFTHTLKNHAQKTRI
jgi:CDP-glycerol glycerophosphotransferase